MDISPEQIAWMREQVGDLGVQQGDLLACYAKESARRQAMTTAAEHVLGEMHEQWVVASVPPSIKISLLSPTDMQACGWTHEDYSADTDGHIRSRRYKDGALGLLRVHAVDGDLLLIGCRHQGRGDRLSKGLAEAYRRWDVDVTTVVAGRDTTIGQPSSMLEKVLGDVGYSRIDQNE